MLRTNGEQRIGLCFAIFGDLSIFFILTWPGLLPNGQAVIARLPGTSAWIAILKLLDVSVVLLMAVLVRWPGNKALVGRRWLAVVVASLGISILLTAGLVAREQYLPSLVGATGALGSLLLTFDGGVLILLAAGAVLSIWRYRHMGDALLGYVALTQVAVAFVVVDALVGAKRYDL